MELIATVFRHRLYAAGSDEGYPEGTVLIFRERLFKRSYRAGEECATVESRERAEAVARALFSGARLEDLNVQMRDARTESQGRESVRSGDGGGANHGG